MFGETKVTPAKPEAILLAKAILELVAAEAELNKVKNNVPSYTGQWSYQDYIEDEEERYNRAADNIYNIIFK